MDSRKPSQYISKWVESKEWIPKNIHTTLTSYNRAQKLRMEFLIYQKAKTFAIKSMRKINTYFQQLNYITITSTEYEISSLHVLISISHLLHCNNDKKRITKTILISNISILIHMKDIITNLVLGNFLANLLQITLGKNQTNISLI